MILSFTVSNYRSFRQEQTLSMVASHRQPDHKQHLVPVERLGQSLLPVAVLYGANGSGKSNLTKALRLVQRLVMDGTQPGKSTGREPFLFGGGGGPDEPSAFELRFLARDQVFSYGFKITDKTIHEEWLDLLTTETRKVNLFERVTGQDGAVTIEAGDGLTDGDLGNHLKVAALAKVGVRANQLFLAGVRETLEAGTYGPLMEAIFGWFEALVVIPPDASFGGLAEWVAKDTKFAEFAGEFLKDAATGVDRLHVVTTDIKDTAAGIPSEFLKKFMEDTKPGEVRMMSLGALGDVIAERGEGSKLRLRTLQAEHAAGDGKPVRLPLREESDGTQRLTHLLPALFQLRQHCRVFVIDEIDRSLHPLLSRKFIEFFLSACKGHGSQLVLTTHESNLMDLDLLRRDEFWFSEKDEGGGTRVYSLSDFKVRTDLKIDKGYLYGRFGAIPFLGNLDRLIQQLNAGGGCH